jgi:integrase
MTVTDCIEEYVKAKKVSGLSFDFGAGRLRCFAKNFREQPLDQITEGQTSEFLGLPPNGDVNWQHKYGLLKGFFEYWKPRYPLRTIPLPSRRRSLPQQYLLPHIYLPEEVKRLIRATRDLQKCHSFAIDPRTYRAFLLVLYGTGCSTGEARNLSISDVDLKRREVTIHNGRRVRKIPLCPQLQCILSSYLRYRIGRFDGASTNLFVNRSGKALVRNTIYQTFRTLRKASGIRPERDRNPSLRDFRPTFAVQRLSEWHKRNLDFEKMVPALAAYMGYVGWKAIERYLCFTPDHFGRQLKALSPRHMHEHWRDDPRLMKFLASL